MAQVTSLRAALNKICEWISSYLAGMPQHYQLVIDLEGSISCCRTLMQSVEEQMESLSRTQDNNLDLGSRVKIVFETKAGKDFQKFIQRQASALTLLLTACNWYNTPTPLLM